MCRWMAYAGAPLLLAEMLFAPEHSLIAPSTRVIVSEPIGRFAQMWQEIPRSSSVSVVGGEVEARPFAPLRNRGAGDSPHRSQPGAQ